MKVNLNLFFPIWLGLALWLGFTNRVDWWIILLIFLYDVKLIAKDIDL